MTTGVIGADFVATRGRTTQMPLYLLPLLTNPQSYNPMTGETDTTSLSCSLSPEEVRQLKDALWKARCDIWQTIRVSEYNLTGKDPNFPSDAPDAIPSPPTLIHRAGLDGSYAVFEEVCEALKMLSGKDITHASNTLPSSPAACLASDPRP